MGKQTGIGDNFYVGAYDLSGDTQALDSIEGPISTLDKTGINVLGFERIQGIRDGKISWKSHFNPATGKQHEVLSALPAADWITSYFHRPSAVGNPAASLVGKQTDYKGSRDNKGDLMFSTENDLNGYALEWGIGLTAGKKTLSGAGAGTSINDVISTTSFGLQAYLHVFAFTGTSAAIVIQASSDDGGSDAYATVTGATFASVTGLTSERIQTGRTTAVEKWLRVNVTGTFSNLVFAVNCVRNTHTVNF